MRKAIYKYVLNPEGDTRLSVPTGAMFLSTQYQKATGQIVLWALVDTNSPTRTLVLSCYPTGVDVEWQESQVYRGTVQLMGGTYVLHVFEKEEVV